MSYHDVVWPDATKLACLVREAQKDQGRALDTLLTTLRPALVCYFARRLSADAAEDLAQDGLLRVAGALHRIDPERADGYVATVARNLLRTAYRRRMMESQRCADVDWLDLLDSREGQDRLAEYEELIRAVHRVAGSALGPELADVVRGLLHGETAVEIAHRQQVSPVTVRTRLLRARMVLRSELREFLARGRDESVVMQHRHRAGRGEAGEAPCGR